MCNDKYYYHDRYGYRRSELFFNQAEHDSYDNYFGYEASSECHDKCRNHITERIDTNNGIITCNENDEYEWNLNKRTDIVIVDEAHKCKNHKSLNGKILLSLKSKCKIILLSATIADKPENFKVFGFCLTFN